MEQYAESQCIFVNLKHTATTRGEIYQLKRIPYRLYDIRETENYHGMKKDIEEWHMSYHILYNKDYDMIYSYEDYVIKKEA